MKIRYETSWGVTEEFESAEEYAIQKLNGDGYESGQIEAIDAAVDCTQQAIGRLLDVLADRFVLNNDDIVKIIEGL